MSEASKFAIALAEEAGIDLSTIRGTGKDGNIKKDDVRDEIKRLSAQIPGTVEVPVTVTAEVPVSVVPNTIDPEPVRHTNIMDAQKAERERQASAAAPSVPEPTSLEVFTPEQMFAVIRDLQSEVKDLKNANASRIEREDYEKDLTDDMLFIAKPNGEKWEERQIIDKKTVLVEFVATAFFGPFKDQEQVDEYLAEKGRKREDSYIRWGDVYVLTGRDSRILQRREKEAREINLKSEVSTNVLDRRIFETQVAGHEPTSRNPTDKQEDWQYRGMVGASQAGSHR